MNYKHWYITAVAFVMSVSAGLGGGALTTGGQSFAGGTLTTGGSVVENISSLQGDSDVSDGVATISGGGTLVLTGESSFDGEVVVTGGRIAENERSADTLSATTSVSSVGVINLSGDTKLSLAGTSSFPDEVVVTGGKLIKNEPTAETAAEEVTVINAENPVADNSVLSGTDKAEQAKALDAAGENVGTEAADSAQSAVMQGGRVFLR
jgi:autotransporter-associated beta strand protein